MAVVREHPSSVSWTVVDGELVRSPFRELARYRMEDVAQHDSASSCWTVVDGRVLDLTGFFDHHPGGKLALLKYGGVDSTELFNEIHTPAAQYADYVDGLTIGTIVGSQPVADAATGAAASEPIEKFFMTQLDSPFPVERFYGTGLESFRFEWAILDQLIAASTDNKPVDEKQAFRNKSKIAPLNDERDWLQLGDPAEYAKQMQIRERLLLGEADTKPMVYLADRDAAQLCAQHELLDMMLEWLPRHHPDKFEYDRVHNQMRTLTPGYVRCFNIMDFMDEPLLLCGLLVQEDLFLLDEQDVHTAPSQVDLSEHKDAHPSGSHHVLTAGLSCFTFDYREKHGLPMSRIHHPFVPGFQMQLQRNINRLFRFNMEPGRIWWRHNYAFESDQVYHCVTFDKPWAKYVVPSELLSEVNPDTPEKTAADAESNSAASAFNPGAGISQEMLSGPEAYDYIDQKMRIHIEYQTLLRLPKSRQIVFTVRTYYDRMAALKQAPAAAQALAAAMRRKYKGIYQYQNLDEPSSMKAMIGWLDDIAHRAGLSPGLAVPGPWERDDDTSKRDGTLDGSPEHDVLLRESRVWQERGFERARSRL